jgi:hypothetical protein
MTENQPISRRGATALAASLSATVVAAIAAFGGIQHWHAQAQVSPAPIAQLAPPAAPQRVEEGD